MTNHSIQFYLDENAHMVIAKALGDRGIDVLTPMKANMIGATDEQHLAFAFEARRVIITQDEDFLVLNSKGYQHAGIVYFKSQTRPIKQILRGLLNLYEDHSADELMGQVIFL
jgi:predicted nuclease of predicted toxin-antitoxin system